MSASKSTARLTHLENCAHYLYAYAPDSAAAFQRDYDRICEDLEMDGEESRMQHVCKACGNMLIPGLSVKIRLGPQTVMSSPSRKQGHKLKAIKIPNGQNQKTLTHVCQRCGKKTKNSVSRSEKKRISVALPNSTSTPHTTTSNGEELQDDHRLRLTNPSGKQRAKTRKQGALHAMLAKSKANAATMQNTGLDLMDFLNKG